MIIKGSLIVSKTSRRRARVISTTPTHALIEWGPGRTQWRLISDIERLYRVV